MYENNEFRENGEPVDETARCDDEGGLRAPPGLTGWRKAWWWFDFIILVKLARLRFIAILVVIGIVITQWDRLAAYYDKWTRPADSASAGGSNVEFFCPMHPTIVRDNSKEKCPICFMPLSKRKKGESQATVLPAGIVSRVQLSPYRVALAGAQTWPVDYIPLTKQIEAVGYIEFNERGEKTVAARVNGRIDKLIVNETGRMVQAGDDLGSIYSPELLVSVQNLVDAKKLSNPKLLADTRVRLQLLGVDDPQIEDILAGKQQGIHVYIRSPITGHVIKKYVKEGQYVQEGMPLYDVADLSTVWIQAQVYEDDLAFLPMTLTSGHELPADEQLAVTTTTRAFPNEKFQGVLTFIYPHLDQQTRTVAVRFELPNPDHKLRPGTTATVTISVPTTRVAMFNEATRSNPERFEMLRQGKMLAVPEAAIIDTGSQAIVYREETPGVYEGVLVKLGPRMTSLDGVNFFPVLEGLEQGDKIVTAGSFLVDAETRLNPAAGSIYFGGSGGSKTGTSTVTNIQPSTPEDPDAKIHAALAKLSAEDRALAQTQKFCPVLTSSALGSMGVPVKLVIEGEPVFLCCSGCKKKAQDHPAETVAKVKGLREKNSAVKSVPMTDGIVVPPQPDVPMPTSSSAEEVEIREALAKLSPADRSLAEAQRYCPVVDGNRLGSMGVPVKVMIDGQPVFLCCEGCERDAKQKPEETLTKVRRLKTSNASGQK